MSNDQLLYGDITDQIIGAAYRVHNELGYGHPEKIYQNCLAVELDKINLNYKRECFSKVVYDNTVVGKYFLDFLVDDKVAVELKVRRNLFKSDWMQLLNYLKAKDLKVGILIVFSKEGLKIKRVVN